MKTGTNKKNTVALVISFLSLAIAIGVGIRIEMIYWKINESRAFRQMSAQSMSLEEGASYFDSNRSSFESLLVEVLEIPNGDYIRNSKDGFSYIGVYGVDGFVSDAQGLTPTHIDGNWYQYTAVGNYFDRLDLELLEVIKTDDLVLFKLSSFTDDIELDQGIYYGIDGFVSDAQGLTLTHIDGNWYQYTWE